MTDRLLVVQSGFLGDAVLASGMVRGLAAAVPEAEIGLAVRAEFAELFHGYPGLWRLHGFDKRSREGTASLIAELRDAGYGTALLAHRSFRSAYIARRAGIPRRVGFRQSDAAWLLTDKVEYIIAAHETDRNASLLERIGIKVAAGNRRARLFPDAEELAAIQERCGGMGEIVVMAPGSVWPTKRWTTEGYADVARRLRAKGYRVLLIGSRGERDLCLAIAAQGGLAPSEVLCGDLTLRETLALITIACRVLANDSAPLHLAESVGTPVTAMFGPTVPEFGFGPVAGHSAVIELGGLPCRPCGIHGAERCPIGTHECMTGISVADVLASVGGSPVA